VEQTGKVANRAVRWQLRTRTLEFGRLPCLMGIVNVTPDSFSDGGHFLDVSAAVDRALQLAADGAGILDVGGESTRPYATPVDEAEELRRVIPVLERVRAQCSTPISIDTSKAAVAREAIACGIEIINDVSALEGDPEMVEVATNSEVGVCAMHMQGTPGMMQDNPVYDNVVDEIHDYLLQRRNWLLAAGIAGERICLDPGIGFGKTHQHNITLLANCHRFHDLGCPLLVGHSRKGFIAKVLQNNLADRTAGTVGVALALALQGVQVIRVHDVASVRQALALFEAVGGVDGNPVELP
jgi:dihydropteroate synthase